MGSTGIALANSALLVIDMQQGFDAPGRPSLSANPDAPALRLLESWRSHGGAVIMVRHDSLEPGSPFAPGHPGNALREGFSPRPGEALIGKSVNSAFIGTDLELRLRRLGVECLVMCGMTSDQCVSTTVRMGSNLGYRVLVASDACAAYDQPGLDGIMIPGAQIHAVHMATLANEFAEVLPVAAIMAKIAA